MSALVVLLKNHAEQNPQASYFNIDILKYHVWGRFLLIWNQRFMRYVLRFMMFDVICVLHRSFQRVVLPRVRFTWSHFGNAIRLKRTCVSTTSTTVMLWQRCSRTPFRALRLHVPTLSHIRPCFRSVLQHRSTVVSSLCSLNPPVNGKNEVHQQRRHRSCLYCAYLLAMGFYF